MIAQSFDTEIVIPEPSRLLEGLRDTGYDFNTAVADIVDNSIAADAEHVKITAYMTMDQGIRLSVADDGIGMDRDGLVSAMKYGAPAREGKHSLGKFGLGLKTASTSCCRRLKVISRNDVDAKPLCAVWDLDYIDSKTRRSMMMRSLTPALKAQLERWSFGKNATDYYRLDTPTPNRRLSSVHSSAALSY